MRRAIEGELERLQCRKRLDLDLWDDGRCRISCPTAMRVLRADDLLDLLKGLDGRTSWGTVWRALFDFPESPV